MDAPLVSVVMPVYGVERYIGAAVRSVLAQSLPAFELIVVDDCTPDGSIEVVQSFADPRVRIVRHERNQGLAAARNTGIAQARGRFVALLDSDDVSPPERLALQVELLDREPTLVGAGGAMQCMDPEGHLYGRVHQAETRASRVPATLLLRNCFFVSSMMFRRSVFGSLRYRTDFRMAEDYEFMVRASRLGRLRNLSQVLLHYRVHPASLTSTKPQLMDECRRRIARDQLERLGCEVGEEGLDAHMRAAIPSTGTTRVQLDAVLAWLKQVSEANRRRALYSQEALDDVLAASWFEACTVASGLGPWVLQRYLRGGLPGRAEIPPARQAKFVAKALFPVARMPIRDRRS